MEKKMGMKNETWRIEEAVSDAHTVASQVQSKKQAF